MSETRRPALTRHTLIETALRLLDDVGLDGLTVRRLATELGVRNPALYWHIRTKQELLDGMADAIILAAGMGPPRSGESWQEWLARRARAYRASLLAHRDGARVVANAANLGPATIRLFDEELTALVGCGFTPVLALRTIGSCTSYINGFVLREQAERPEVAGEPSDRLAAVAALLERGMDATLMRAFREGASALGEEAFEHGLRVLIDGTAAALQSEGERSDGR
ncbi:TetR/AcrR family transcriptional regulator, tetracycline repressor protein [Nonomuraea solani]|uniref:TetR/AcrR family transcriptional regulator, tetracycline repressor protein n=1 Tax=Nonomuraea solani TaxID=1144553 RepID=A0A1H6EXF0_9ACTN|nr:TetR/AcrR family transcriptional regulator C-terminal domain-containing protein [Nonomuraea solani]SEH01791.1 TetR/AcrR family transcriptional regulator, tetracycline repressor protein [Nonomuraea solani]